ncbi:MAG TPA: hypothetical protein VJ959_13155 [Desulfotignum sp.]|nr:hypothetical protein [Desulfotignum sp.]
MAKEEQKKKDHCDAEDQKNVVDKMKECDNTSETDKERDECYNKVVKEDDDGCMSS